VDYGRREDSAKLIRAHYLASHCSNFHHPTELSIDEAAIILLYQDGSILAPAARPNNLLPSTWPRLTALGGQQQHQHDSHNNNTGFYYKYPLDHPTGRINRCCLLLGPLAGLVRDLAPTGLFGLVLVQLSTTHHRGPTPTPHVRDVVYSATSRDWPNGRMRRLDGPLPDDDDDEQQQWRRQ
jgi:hypothetical protein